MKAIRVALTVLTLIAAAACQKNTTNPTDSRARVGVGPSGRNVKIEQCQVGEVYDSEFGCMKSGDQCPEGQGYAREAGLCVEGKLVTEKIALGAKTSDHHFARVKISNRDRFIDMLEESEICGDYATGNMTGGRGYMMGSRFGNSDCESLIDAGVFIVIDSASTEIANVRLGAGTNFPEDLLPKYSEFSGQYSDGFYSFFSQKVESKAINFDAGVELVSQPKTVPFRIQIEKGNLASQKFTARIMYNNTEVGTANVRRLN
ncbi:MAG TPA: hypothetical protein VM432_04325 [Bdellovibrionales bacterium]|nr:hypothetical protein [Bdellovibrionales bacterium]